MASIVDISPPRAAPTPAFRRLRMASGGLEWLFAGLFWAFVALAVFSLWVLWAYQGTLITVGPPTTSP